jgi:membrane-bound lytic murein transglycosylase B
MKNYGYLIIAAALGLMLGLSRPAAAQEEDFAQWLASLKREAVEQGVPADTLERALAGVEPLRRVLELDREQPESTLTLDRYLKSVVSSARVAKGRVLKVRHKALLRTVSERYGVPPKVILALWAIESGFGESMGSFRVVDALATLAYDGRRPEFFRGELIGALKILGQGGFEAADLKGSWAGAMGQVQFMPSTYLRYAVNYNHPGQPDIWHAQGDVFASAANYLSSLGWKRNDGWGREVVLPDRFDRSLIGLTVTHSVAEWVQMGVRRIGGARLPANGASGSIVQPDGVGGRAFLINDNFRVIMKWNHSTFFALAVGLLADGIGI